MPVTSAMTPSRGTLLLPVPTSTDTHVPTSTDRHLSPHPPASHLSPHPLTDTCSHICQLLVPTSTGSHLPPHPPASHLFPYPPASHLSSYLPANHLFPHPPAGHLSPHPPASHLFPHPPASHLSHTHRPRPLQQLPQPCSMVRSLFLCPRYEQMLSSAFLPPMAASILLCLLQFYQTMLGFTAPFTFELCSNSLGQTELWYWRSWASLMWQKLEARSTEAMGQHPERQG